MIETNARRNPLIVQAGAPDVHPGLLLFVSSLEVGHSSLVRGFEFRHSNFLGITSSS
jgi:hypothetical protein